MAARAAARSEGDHAYTLCCKERHDRARHPRLVTLRECGRTSHPKCSCLVHGHAHARIEQARIVEPWVGTKGKGVEMNITPFNRRPECRECRGVWAGEQRLANVGRSPIGKSALLAVKEEGNQPAICEVREGRITPTQIAGHLHPARHEGV